MKKLKAICFAVSAFSSLAMPAAPDTLVAPGIAAEWHDNYRGGEHRHLRQLELRKGLPDLSRTRLFLGFQPDR